MPEVAQLAHARPASYTHPCLGASKASGHNCSTTCPLPFRAGTNLVGMTGCSTPSTFPPDKKLKNAVQTVTQSGPASPSSSPCHSLEELAQEVTNRGSSHGRGFRRLTCSRCEVECEERAYCTPELQALTMTLGVNFRSSFRSSALIPSQTPCLL